MQSVHTTHEKFKKHFPDPHSIVVALHATSIAHALEQANIALSHGADGIALVTHHPLSPEKGYEAISRIKNIFPYHKAIINVLQKNPEEVFTDIYNKGLENIVDGVWTDNARLQGVDWIPTTDIRVADRVKNIQLVNEYPGLYFGGLNFKHQQQTPNENLGPAALTAKAYLDVITTSGPSTGHSADPEQISFMKSVIGDHPFAIASGVTTDNFHEFAPHLDLTFVNTGVSKNYNDLDPEKVKALMKKRDKYNSRELRRQYEKDVLEQYGVPDFIALKKKLSDMGAINITSGSSDELEKKLSNLYYSPFVLDGIEYASIEAFRMSIKYPINNPNHFNIRQLHGIEAKKAGNDVKHIKTLQYNGHTIITGSDIHHELLKRALRAKFTQHPDIAQLLKESGNRHIVHIPFYKDGLCIYPDSKTIPGEIFSQLIMEIRTELQQA